MFACLDQEKSYPIQFLPTEENLSHEELEAIIINEKFNVIKEPEFHEENHCEYPFCDCTFWTGGRHHCRMCGISVCVDHQKENVDLLRSSLPVYEENLTNIPTKLVIAASRPPLPEVVQFRRACLECCEIHNPRWVEIAALASSEKTEQLYHNNDFSEDLSRAEIARDAAYASVGSATIVVEDTEKFSAAAELSKVTAIEAQQEALQLANNAESALRDIEKCINESDRKYSAEIAGINAALLSIDVSLAALEKEQRATQATIDYKRDALAAQRVELTAELVEANSARVTSLAMTPDEQKVAAGGDTQKAMEMNEARLKEVNKEFDEKQNTVYAKLSALEEVVAVAEKEWAAEASNPEEVVRKKKIAELAVSRRDAIKKLLDVSKARMTQASQHELVVNGQDCAALAKDQVTRATDAVNNALRLKATAPSVDALEEAAKSSSLAVQYAADTKAKVQSALEEARRKAKKAFKEKVLEQSDELGVTETKAHTPLHSAELPAPETADCDEAERIKALVIALEKAMERANEYERSAAEAVRVVDDLSDKAEALRMAGEAAVNTTLEAVRHTEDSAHLASELEDEAGKKAQEARSSAAEVAQAVSMRHAEAQAQAEAAAKNVP
mmetsp:Transcript_108736/g.213036  ORF Transcript_108736/g.213036 Transcript_108736/m.213036 type:complete len:617 (+) Transcript_108736:71-1921(+)